MKRPLRYDEAHEDASSGWIEDADGTVLAIAMREDAEDIVRSVNASEAALAALAVISPERLEKLADWITLMTPDNPNHEVQDDLRRMAELSRAASDARLNLATESHNPENDNG